MIRIGALGLAGVLGFGIAAAVLTTPDVARADTLPATGGHAAFWSEATCFTSVWNRVQNTGCAGEHWYIVPITLRTATFASTTWTFRASSTDTGTAANCRVVLRLADNSALAMSNMIPVTTDNIIFQQTVSQLSAAQYECTMGQNQKSLVQVHWTQDS
jgi:hypothetical protein